MGYRFDEHYKLRIDVEMSFADACTMMAEMPMDPDFGATIQIRWSVPSTICDGRKEYSFLKERTCISLDYTTYYHKKWLSEMHEWIKFLIDNKQGTIENNDRYALYCLHTEAEGTIDGIETYELWKSADRSFEDCEEGPEEHREGASTVVEQLRARANAVAAGEI